MWNDKFAEIPTNEKIDDANQSESENSTGWSGVHGDVGVEIVLRIHCRQVTNANHRQEEQCREVLENRTNFPSGLDLVPLVGNKVCSPDRDRWKIARCLVTTFGRYHSTRWPFPVDEENVNGSLNGWKKDAS